MHRFSAFILRALLLSLALFALVRVFSQTSISGIINNYQPVTAITPNGCHTDIELAGITGFAVGDSILLIQMKGAVIDSSNSATFGTIANLNGAGNHEIKLITAIAGTTLTLLGPLTNTYDLNGKVQAISFPSYPSANVTAPLTAAAWNGTIGGVLAFRVWGTLDLGADISVDGLGFRGGMISNNPDGSCGSGSPDWFYPLWQPGAFWTSGGAEKGEGIAVISAAKSAGKGSLANGGGGGNKHNFGGGGGGNFTRGGKGGGPLQGCPNTGDGGEGGASLAVAINAGALFLGGGGGRGDDNNAAAQSGVAGGGIILIIADHITGNGHSISANGLSQTIAGVGIADGNGGGGAGGTMLLSVASYSGALSLTANGGDGGDQLATWGCVGTGGGGGTGAVVSCSGPLPANVSATTDEGHAGVFLTIGYTCTGTTYFAFDGDPNISGAVVLSGCFPPPPIVTALDNDVIASAALCVGDTLFLDSVTTGASYLWQDGSTDTLLVIGAPGPVTVQTTLGCDAVIDTATITITQTPALDYIGDATLCPGDTLFVDPVLPGATMFWQNGSVLPFMVVNGSGSYTINVVLGCDTASDAALVDFPPPASVDLGPDTALCPDNWIALNADAGLLDFHWEDSSTISSRLIIDPGTYILTAYDACDRAAIDSIIVSRADCSCYLYVPNGFTPDADGMNDVVRPLHDCDLREYNFMIFDRWGELIFRTSDPEQAWDGSVGGSPAQIGVYVFKVGYRSMHALEPMEVFGHIALVR